MISINFILSNALSEKSALKNFFIPKIFFAFLFQLIFLIGLFGPFASPLVK